MTVLATALKDRLSATIRTQRLVLATPALAHAPAIAALANNANVHKWLARLPFPYALADAEYFITEIARSETEFAWVILADDAVTGIVGLHLRPGMLPELGYWLSEPHWGQGLATEAGEAAVAAARAAGAPGLRSRARKDNTGSRRVLEKLGFAEIAEETEREGNLTGQTMVLMRLEFSQR